MMGNGLQERLARLLASTWGTKLHAGGAGASPKGEAGLRVHSGWAGKMERKKEGKGESWGKGIMKERRG